MNRKSKCILILVAAEEKWAEADFLCKKIQTRGFTTKMLDMGLVGKPQRECDFPRERVITASGEDPENVSMITDRGQRMPFMIAGAQKIVSEFYADGRLSGIVSLGGTTGTQMGTRIMQALPFGFPKLAISSTAALPGFASRYIGTSDITLMHSVVEIAGRNRMLKNVLYRAAGAICGMAEGADRAPVGPGVEGEKPMVAMTHFGPCELCATEVRKGLEEKGYDVIGFSAAGIGDRALEEIIGANNVFTAVIDLAPGGVGEEILGFSRAAGPNRMEAAGKAGIPQVISVCGVNFGTPLKRKYKPEYEARKQYDYDSARTFIRLSSEELRKVAMAMAAKMNKARGPVKVVIPLGGWSAVDRKGTYFYDGEADREFAEELKKNLHYGIEIREVDHDLETPEFAAAVIQAFDEVMINDLEYRK